MGICISYNWFRLKNNLTNSSSIDFQEVPYNHYIGECIAYKFDQHPGCIHSSNYYIITHSVHHILSMDADIVCRWILPNKNLSHNSNSFHCNSYYMIHIENYKHNNLCPLDRNLYCTKGKFHHPSLNKIYIDRDKFDTINWN